MSTTNAREMQKCLADIAHQCILHKGKGFIFPTDIISFPDDFNYHGIEWHREKSLGGVLSIARIVNVIRVQRARCKYKRDFKGETGLKCCNYKRNLIYGVTVDVTDNYSSAVYENYLRRSVDKSIIVESNELQAEIIALAKEFQVEVLRSNNDTIETLASLGSENFGQNYVNVTEDRLEITTGNLHDVVRTIPFLNYGLKPISEKYQLYGVARAIAMQISSNKGYPKMSNDSKKIYVKITMREKKCWITSCAKSICDETKSWG